MKNSLNKLLIILTIIFLTFCACKKNIDTVGEGIIKIYIPQAVMLDGGVTHSYNVPKKNGLIENYKIDSVSQKLSILLGVKNSGNGKNGFTVNVLVDRDSTNEIVNQQKIINAVALPEGYYSLPTNATVPQGKNEVSFNLDVDLGKLISDYPSFARKKIILVVSISGASNYNIESSLSKVVIVIDGATFMPTPPIITNGDMEEGSEASWKILNLESESSVSSGTVSFIDGKMRLTYGKGPVTKNTAIYQTIELTKGQKYKLYADFTASGEALNGEIFLLISQTKPELGKYYNKTGVFLHSDTWAGKLINPYAGDFLYETSWKKGFDETGIFTSEFSGQGYFIIVFASWEGNVGTLTLDNIKIEPR